MKPSKLLKLLKAASKKRGTEVDQVILNAFMDSLPKDLLDVLLASVVPDQYVDKEILTALCPHLENKIQDIYMRFQSLPVVEKYGYVDGYNVHEYPRKLLLLYLQEKEPIRYLEYSKRTEDYLVSKKIGWILTPNIAVQHLTRLTIASSAQAALITIEKKLWAYSGMLLPEVTDEITQAIENYYSENNDSNLVKFIHLKSTNSEHMLYATRLSPLKVLAMIFDAETPFSTIRGQAKELVDSLAEQKNIKSVANADYLSSEIVTVYNLQPTSTADSELPQKTVHKPRQSYPIEFAESDQKTPSYPNVEMAKKIVLEPVQPAVYNLDYACLLIPRYIKHKIVNDLADQLTDRMGMICVEYDWKLEYISVRPEYLQWIVNVPPATSPGYLMRIIRQYTSEYIFSAFPELKRENPSGDFWAPGYLIMGGSQPPPAQLIKDFLQQTRQRQGMTEKLL
jgi:REP element-mobilizing transposase RayT